MMVKIFSRGAGGGKGVIDYMLGKDREREKARVLDGDAEQTLELIDGLDFSRNYTAGVLSFAERADQLTNEQKNAIMARFEECAFNGLDGDQYNILWVEHSDKNGRLELNFVIPNVELQSGKRLQPYYDRIDRGRFNDFQTIVNHEYSLADPHDPQRKRTVTTAKDLPRDKKAAVEAITHDLSKQIEAGLIENRDDIVKTLETAGFTVARQTKTSISIADPSGGNNIRLKGAIYEQSFRASAELEQAVRESAKAFRDGAEERYRAAQRSYKGGLDRLRDFNQKRYSKDRRRVERPIAPAAQGRIQASSQEAEPIIYRPIGGTRPHERGVDGELLLWRPGGEVSPRGTSPRGRGGESEQMLVRDGYSPLRSSERRRELEKRGSGHSLHGNSEITAVIASRRNSIGWQTADQLPTLDDMPALDQLPTLGDLDARRKAGHDMQDVQARHDNVGKGAGLEPQQQARADILLEIERFNMGHREEATIGRVQPVPRGLASDANEDRTAIIERIGAATEAAQRSNDSAHRATRRTREATQAIERQQRRERPIYEAFNRSAEQVKRKVKGVITAVERALRERQEAREYRGFER